MTQLRTLDLIIPVYNEEQVMPLLIAELERVFSLENLAKHRIQKVRCIMIDDGSRDSSVQQILAWSKRTKLEVKLIIFSRNFGHQPAVTAGLNYSDGDFVAIIDADLQDPPELVFKMIELADQGYDVVYGVRAKRKENIFLRTMYWGFYRLLRFLSDVEVPVNSGDFGLMTKATVDVIKTLPERVRFPRGLRAWIGFRQIGLTYDRPARASGDAKYTVKMLYNLATHGLASMSIKPLRITQLLLLFSLASFFIITFVIIHLMRSAGQNPNDIWFLAGFALTIFVSALNFFCLYIMSAYIGRTYIEVKARPNYVASSVIDNFTTNS